MPIGSCDWVDVVDPQRTAPQSPANIEIYEGIGQKQPAG